MSNEKLKQQVVNAYPEATPGQIAEIVEVSERTGLSVLFPAQLVPIFPRLNGKKTMALVVKIDAMRAAGDRTGQYAGQRGPQWCGEDGVWRDVWVSETHPVAARVAVMRQGFQEPLWGVAHWHSFVQTKWEGNQKVPNAMWGRFGELMLAKCAEGQAWRRAFPTIFGGVYEESEIDLDFGGDSPDSSEPTDDLMPKEIEPPETRTRSPKPEVAPQKVATAPKKVATAPQKVADAPEKVADAPQELTGGLFADNVPEGMRKVLVAKLRNSGKTQAEFLETFGQVTKENINTALGRAAQ